MKGKFLKKTHKVIVVAGLTLLVMLFRSNPALAMTNEEIMTIGNESRIELTTASVGIDKTEDYLSNIYKSIATPVPAPSQSEAKVDNVKQVASSSKSVATPAPTPAPVVTKAVTTTKETTKEHDISQDVKVKGGTVNLEKNKITLDNGKTSDTASTDNKKYKELVNDINKHFGAKTLVPVAYANSMRHVYYDSYKEFTKPSNITFLAKLADKYELTSPTLGKKNKANIVLATYFGLYNRDKLVVYNTDSSARISRKEFYVLFGRADLTYGSPQFIPSEVKKDDPLYKTIGQEYGAYTRKYFAEILVGTTASKKDLESNIKRYEVAMLIALRNFRYESDKYAGESLLDYCKDIAPQQIVNYNDLNTKYKQSGTKDPFRVYLIKNKYIVEEDQQYIILALHKGILKVDANGKLNLFNNVTYNQAIQHLLDASVPWEYTAPVSKIKK